MIRQKSFQNNSATLYLVATPIGNMEDITYRAINTLKSVDIIYAEDTRVSSGLLKYYSIENKLSCYHEFNKETQSKAIIRDLENGKNVALISDAGMPIISDPGFTVSKMAMECGFNVVAIPGANAALSALIVSGISPSCFTFYGFLDSKSGKRIKQLEEIKNNKETIILYESPHRISETLKDIYHVFGNREMSLVREITKKFEEIARGSVEEIIEIADEIKGEIVLIIEGNKKEKNYEHLTVIEHVNLYIKEGLMVNDAIKKVALDRQMIKQDVYKIYHKI